jgi:hypothetical protein
MVMDSGDEEVLATLMNEEFDVTATEREAVGKEEHLAII